MEKLNAIVYPTRNYIPVCRLVQLKGVMVSNGDTVWKGEILPSSVKDPNGPTTLYFIMSQKAETDFDKQWPIVQVLDDSLAGESFVLIPREKVLFSYAEPSLIARPDPSIFSKGRKGGSNG